MGPSGEKAGTGGIGQELQDQHVGKVWTFEEGDDRNGGTGSDSSVENEGKEDVCRNGHGGIDSRVDFAEEHCVGVGGFGSSEFVGVGGCESRESHMNTFLGLVRDKRRILSSLHFQSCPPLIAPVSYTHLTLPTIYSV